LLFVTAVLAALSPVRGAVADLVGDAVPFAEPAIVPPPKNNPAAPFVQEAIPDASASLHASARGVLRHSKALHALLGPTGYKVLDEGPWTTTHTQELLGIAFLIAPDRPITIRGSWPTARLDPSERGLHPFVTRHFTYEAKAVRQMLVLVESAPVASAGASKGAAAATRVATPLQLAATKDATSATDVAGVQPLETGGVIGGPK